MWNLPVPGSQGTTSEVVGQSEGAWKPRPRSCPDQRRRFAGSQRSLLPGSCGPTRLPMQVEADETGGQRHVGWLVRVRCRPVRPGGSPTVVASPVPRRGCRTGRGCASTAGRRPPKQTQLLQAGGIRPRPVPGSSRGGSRRGARSRRRRYSRPRLGLATTAGSVSLRRWHRWCWVG